MPVIYCVFSLPYYVCETCPFIQIQNKMPKSKQLLTSKYDNAKYLFPYFSLMKIIISQIKVFFLKISERFWLLSLLIFV